MAEKEAAVGKKQEGVSNTEEDERKRQLQPDAPEQLTSGRVEGEAGLLKDGCGGGGGGGDGEGSDKAQEKLPSPSATTRLQSPTFGLVDFPTNPPVFDFTGSSVSFTSPSYVFSNRSSLLSMAPPTTAAAKPPLQTGAFGGGGVVATPLFAPQPQPSSQPATNAPIRAHPALSLALSTIRNLNPPSGAKVATTGPLQPPPDSSNTATLRQPTTSLGAPSKQAAAMPMSTEATASTPKPSGAVAAPPPTVAETPVAAAAAPSKTEDPTVFDRKTQDAVALPTSTTMKGAEPFLGYNARARVTATAASGVVNRGWGPLSLAQDGAVVKLVHNSENPQRDVSKIDLTKDTAFQPIKEKSIKVTTPGGALVVQHVSRQARDDFHKTVSEVVQGAKGGPQSMPPVGAMPATPAAAAQAQIPPPSSSSHAAGEPAPAAVATGQKAAVATGQKAAVSMAQMATVSTAQKAAAAATTTAQSQKETRKQLAKEKIKKRMEQLEREKKAMLEAAGKNRAAKKEDTSAALERKPLAAAGDPNSNVAAAAAAAGATTGAALGAGAAAEGAPLPSSGAATAATAAAVIGASTVESTPAAGEVKPTPTPSAFAPVQKPGNLLWDAGQASAPSQPPQNAPAPIASTGGNTATDATTAASALDAANVPKPSATTTGLAFTAEAPTTSIPAFSSATAPPAATEARPMEGVTGGQTQAQARTTLTTPALGKAFAAATAGTTVPTQLPFAFGTKPQTSLQTTPLATNAFPGGTSGAPTTTASMFSSAAAGSAPVSSSPTTTPPLKATTTGAALQKSQQSFSSTPFGSASVSLAKVTKATVPTALPSAGSSPSAAAAADAHPPAAKPSPFLVPPSFGMNVGAAASAGTSSKLNPSAVPFMPTDAAKTVPAAAAPPVSQPAPPIKSTAEVGGAGAGFQPLAVTSSSAAASTATAAAAAPGADSSAAAKSSKPILISTMSKATPGAVPASGTKLISLVGSKASTALPPGSLVQGVSPAEKAGQTVMAGGSGAAGKPLAGVSGSVAAPPPGTKPSASPKSRGKRKKSMEGGMKKKQQQQQQQQQQLPPLSRPGETAVTSAVAGQAGAPPLGRRSLVQGGSLQLAQQHLQPASQLSPLEGSNNASQIAGKVTTTALTSASVPSSQSAQAEQTVHLATSAVPAPSSLMQTTTTTTPTVPRPTGQQIPTATTPGEPMQAKQMQATTSVGKPANAALPSVASTGSSLQPQPVATPISAPPGGAATNVQGVHQRIQQLKQPKAVDKDEIEQRIQLLQQRQKERQQQQQQPPPQQQPQQAAGAAKHKTVELRAIKTNATGLAPAKSAGPGPAAVVAPVATPPAAAAIVAPVAPPPAAAIVAPVAPPPSAASAAEVVDGVRMVVEEAKERMKRKLDAIRRPRSCRDPEDATEDGHDQARPWNREDFNKRLRTFEATRWPCKWEAIAPVDCARRGWMCVGPNKLRSTEGLTITFDAHASNPVAERDRVRSLVVSKGHRLLSAWIGDACAESFADTPPEFCTTSAVMKRAATLSTLALRVQPSSRTTSMLSVREREELHRRWNRDGGSQSGESVAILAAFGWTARPLLVGKARKIYLFCELCGVMVPLEDIADLQFDAEDEHRWYCPIVRDRKWQTALLAAHRDGVEDRDATISAEGSAPSGVKRKRDGDDADDSGGKQGQKERSTEPSVEASDAGERAVTAQGLSVDAKGTSEPVVQPESSKDRDPASGAPPTG